MKYGWNVTRPLSWVIANYKDGDERQGGWSEEFEWLWSNLYARMTTLMALVEQSGIQNPILLGSDGRVWDGHKRLAVAEKLGIVDIPVDILPLVEKDE